MSRLWAGLDANVEDRKVRIALERINLQLHSISRDLSAFSPGSVITEAIGEPYITVSNTAGLDNERRLQVGSPLTLNDAGPNSTITLNLAFSPPVIALGNSAVEGIATAVIRADATIKAFDDAGGNPAGDAAVPVDGVVNFASRQDHQHVYPDRLQVSGPTTQLQLTSGAGFLRLAPSAAGDDVVIADQSSVIIAKAFDSADLARGMWINGHSLVGQGTSASGLTPSAAAILMIAEDCSDVAGAFSTGLQIRPVFDTDTALGSGTISSARYDAAIATGFDASGGGTFDVHSLNLTGSCGTMTAGLSRLALINAAGSITLGAASPQWTDLIGLFIPTLNIGTVAPLRSYGLRIDTAGNGATAWAGIFNGDVQIRASNKLLLGGTATTKASDTIYRRAAGFITLQIGSTDELELSATALYPTTNAGLGLGQNANGFNDLWIKDTSASFEVQHVCTSSTTLTADRVFTLDMADGSRTLKLTGNVTGNQDVSTTGTPQFARIGIGAAADGSRGFTLTDTSGSDPAGFTPTAGWTHTYGASDNGKLLGTPSVWFFMRDGATTYRVPGYAN